MTALRSLMLVLVFLGAVSPASTAAITIYASHWGCALNTSINSGGGTDDSACLQRALNQIIDSGGGTLVLDGFALVSNANISNKQTTALETGSNVTIDATGGGVFLAANSNCPMLGNAITGNPAANFQTGIRVIGGEWNGNEANQSKSENADPNRQWVFGFWFGGFNGLTLDHVTVRNAKTFSIVLGNGKNFVIQNTTSAWDDARRVNRHQGLNRDGLHMFGTLANGRILNYTSNGDDDVLAFNTDEGVSNYVSNPVRWRRDRLPWSGGEISNIYVDGVNFNDSSNGVRWIGYSATGGVPVVSNITLRNIRGKIVQTPMQNSGIISAGPITIDGWQVKGRHNALNLPVSSHLSLRNIRKGVAITVGGAR